MVLLLSSVWNGAGLGKHTTPAKVWDSLRGDVCRCEIYAKQYVEATHAASRMSL